MRTTRMLLASMLLTGALVGCDQVDDPTPPRSTNGGTDTSEQVVRKVLLEDITGHRCNNCPRAARIAQALKEDLFGDNLILVGVHAGGFASPYPPIGDGFYDSDHRTAAGITYQQSYLVSFFPAGLVSRRVFQNSRVVSEGSWGSAVAEIAGQPSPFDLSITNSTVQSGRITASVKLKFAEGVQGDHRLVVYLVEDHVTDWQLDAEATPPDVENYDHRHMLRANLNGTWGEVVVSGSAQAGDSISLNTPEFDLNPAWNTAELYIVAWIYDAATEEVMQVEERKHQP